MKWIVAAAILVSAATAPAAAQLGGDEASIGNVDSDGIAAFQIYDAQTVFLQTPDVFWFQVTLAEPCPALLEPKIHLAYESNHGVFDKTSAIRVKGQRCAVKSVVRVPAPPAKAPKH